MRGLIEGLAALGEDLALHRGRFPQEDQRAQICEQRRSVGEVTRSPGEHPRLVALWPCSDLTRFREEQYCPAGQYFRYDPRTPETSQAPDPPTERRKRHDRYHLCRRPSRTSSAPTTPTTPIALEQAFAPGRAPSSTTADTFATETELRESPASPGLDPKIVPRRPRTRTAASWLPVTATSRPGRCRSRSRSASVAIDAITDPAIEPSDPIERAARPARPPARPGAAQRGEHAIDSQIDGRLGGRDTFELTAEEATSLSLRQRTVRSSPSSKFRPPGRS